MAFICPESYILLWREKDSCFSAPTPHDESDPSNAVSADERETSDKQHLGNNQINTERRGLHQTVELQALVASLITPGLFGGPLMDSLNLESIHFSSIPTKNSSRQRLPSTCGYQSISSIGIIKRSPPPSVSEGTLRTLQIKKSFFRCRSSGHMLELGLELGLEPGLELEEIYISVRFARPLLSPKLC